MIWQNPWAWAGLSVLAIPILIHMLGRSPAPLQRFPTLRFLQMSRLLPTRRTHLHDLPLLILRLLILSSAVAALARPLMLFADRQRRLDASLVSAIIVDTSASMHRLSATGVSGTILARQQAQQLSDRSQTSVVLATSSPSEAVPGALAWLAHQSGRGDLVVISDFQLGALDHALLASVPDAVGITLVRLPLDTTVVSREWVSRQYDDTVVAHVTPSPARTDVVWTASKATFHDGAELLAGSNDSAQLAAANLAARSVGVQLPVASQRPVSIVYPGYSMRGTLLTSAKPLTVPWMGDVLTRVAQDPLFLTAASSLTTPTDTAHAEGTLLIRSATGLPLLLAGEDRTSTDPRLLLFTFSQPGSLISVALIASVNRTMSLAGSPAELEPEVLGDSVLNAWQRPPAQAGVVGYHDTGKEGVSDGHWLWGVALLLLAIEWLVRRRSVTAGGAIESRH